MSDMANDPDFAKKVRAVMEAQLPNIVIVESWLGLRAVAVVVGLVGFLGFLLYHYGPEIAREKLIKPAILEVLKQELAGKDSPVTKVAGRVGTISQVLHDTFGSQVDSGTYKILQFGCTPRGLQPSGAYPACSDDTAVITMQKDNQTILVVASPSRQRVRINLSAYGSTPDQLTPLYLEVFAESATIQPGIYVRRDRLEINPEDVDDHTRDFVEAGRLRLVASSGLLNTHLDLTRALKNGQWDKVFLLRFLPVVKVDAPASRAGFQPSQFRPAPGTELFRIRTVTTVFHDIPTVESSEQP